MKTQVVIAMFSLWCISVGMSATAYIWNGPDEGLWSEPGNWLPNGTPGTDTADTVEIIADPDIASIIVADVSCTVQSVMSTGKVIIRGTLDSTGYPENTLDTVLTNGGFLDIWNMILEGQVINQAGSLMKLRQIRGAAQYENYGDLRWYLVNVLSNASLITNYGKMNVMDPGVLDSFGSMLNTGGIAINFSNLAFEPGATVVNEGTIYGAGNLILLGASLSNSGTIKSMFGDLLVVSSGQTVNDGILNNEPGTLLFLTTQGPTPLLNNGQIRAYSGGGVSLYPSHVSNEAGGLIELKGGFLRALSVDIQPYSTIQGRGELIGSLYIYQDATAEFYRELTVTGSLEIDPSVEVVFEDADVLVEGNLTNEGMIRLKSSRLIPRGGLSGGGQVVWDISDYNTLTDYNFDGSVNMQDLAVFSQTWLWQSPF